MGGLATFNEKLPAPEEALIKRGSEGVGKECKTKIVKILKKGKEAL